MDNARQPLEGRRIVITRAPEQAAGLVKALVRLGAEVALLPTVTFAPPEDWHPVDQAIARLAEFDWIFFTSQNAVRFFAQRRTEPGRHGEQMQLVKLQVAAVGPATAEVATKEGFRVDYVATDPTGESLVRELAASVRGCRVLLPRSDRADRRLPNALRQAGALVTEVVAYRTAAPDELDPVILGQVRRGQVDAILFASPSAFHNLCDLTAAPELAKLSDRTQFVAIGPTTARALREAGVRVEIEAPDTSAAGLADAIGSYYRRQPFIARRA